MQVSDTSVLEKREAFFKKIEGKDFYHCARIEDVYVMGDELVVISQYIPGETLLGFENRISEQESINDLCDRLKRYISDILCSLESLHSSSFGTIIHRDLNPKNIIINASGAYLIDLGISRIFSDEKNVDTQIIGTHGYAAPEQYGFGQTNAYSDIYSLGMVLYYVMACSEPKNFLTTNFSATLLIPEMESVIKKAISLNPKDRYSTAQTFRRDFENSYTKYQKRIAVKRKPIQASKSTSKKWTPSKILHYVWNSVIVIVLLLIGIGTAGCFDAYLKTYPSSQAFSKSLALFVGSMLMVGFPFMFSFDLFKWNRRIVFLRGVKTSTLVASCYGIDLILFVAFGLIMPSNYL